MPWMPVQLFYRVEEREASFSSSLLWLLQVLHLEQFVKFEREEAFLTAKNYIYRTGGGCLTWVHLKISYWGCHREQH